MRFYQFESKRKIIERGHVVGETVVTTWHGTEREAVQLRGTLFKANLLAGLKRESKIYPIDVPTDKAGLLAFLKANVQVPVVI